MTQKRVKKVRPVDTFQNPQASFDSLFRIGFRILIGIGAFIGLIVWLLMRFS